jgi:hypothetical protein
LDPLGYITLPHKVEPESQRDFRLNVMWLWSNSQCRLIDTRVVYTTRFAASKWRSESDRFPRKAILGKSLKAWENYPKGRFLAGTAKICDYTREYTCFILAEVCRSVVVARLVTIINTGGESPPRPMSRTRLWISL